ncbi:MAG: heparinase [Mucilaginibacter sp.]|uniref:heparinase II/III domain-containing protein n=1 Tax=Mucilaginibacter sp. TaxID=1882438 RepID=UPI00260C5629|nr:heparinase II/III family protein [Mucilaginibacter sp.]MDB5004326.1 heparinase [Mucilaginibacter sp.]
MKIFRYLLTIILICVTCFTYAQVLSTADKIPDHPRLLLLKGQDKELLISINADASLLKIHQAILKNCDAMINIAPLQYKKIGKRLLDVSREAIHRIFYLSYGYRMTHNSLYLQQAQKELIAVSSFADWNPTHYLDVGEMTMAVSIGYDWLYNDLSESTKALVKDAILNKGINTSTDKAYNYWLAVNNNWNQVCNAGITYGALATYEDHPDLSVQMINRAIISVDLPMQAYKPDGAYPEGYGYWEYGTSFNVMLISALETAFGKDFGLSAKPGFLKTPGYLENMTGIKGQAFNYSDAGTGQEFNPAMFWFANKLHDPSLLWTEKVQLDTRAVSRNRLLPATLIWAKGLQLDKITKPKATMWVGGGLNPVAMMRTSWDDPNAIFVGLKAGSPSVNHAHMDAGSFVMEADGVRWGIDLGMQDYESLESKKVDLWNNKQNSQRWQILRYNNFNHSTLTIDDGLQEVKGSATIISSSVKPVFKNTVVDLTSLYSQKVAKAIRGIAIIDQKYVLVRDELESLSDSITVRWSMVTGANINVTGKNSASLTKDGKTLLLQASGTFPVEVKAWSTAPKMDYDAPNPGTGIVGLEMKIPAHTKGNINVMLVPQSQSIQVSQQTKPLAQWPKDSK